MVYYPCRDLATTNKELEWGGIAKTEYRIRTVEDELECPQIAELFYHLEVRLLSSGTNVMHTKSCCGYFLVSTSDGSSVGPIDRNTCIQTDLHQPRGCVERVIDALPGVRYPEERIV